MRAASCELRAASCELRAASCTSGRYVAFGRLIEGGKLLDFIAAFKFSLFGKEPTKEQMASQCRDLGTAKNSVLFNGYGWKLEVNGECYEKN